MYAPLTGYQVRGGVEGGGVFTASIRYTLRCFFGRASGVLLVELSCCMHILKT